MSPSAAPTVVKHEDHSGPGVAAMVTSHSDKCSRLSVPSVARKLRYRSNPVKVDRYIAVSATTRPD